MADEQIIVEFVAQTSNAIANAEQWRETLENLKKTIFDTATSSKVAIKDLETAWIKSVQAMKAQEISQARAGVTPAGEIIPKEDIAARVKEIREYYSQLIATGKAAFKEAKADQKSYFDEQAKLGTQQLKAHAELVKARTALEKQYNAQVKAQYQEAAGYAAEYAKITKQGYGEMSVGAQTFGAQVQGVKQTIQEIAASSGQSFKQVAHQLREAGVPIPQINQALKELGAETKKAGSSFKIFGQEIANVGDLARVVLLGIFGVSVIGMFRGLARSIGEATKSGYEFAKSIFQLEVGARALQRAGVDITIEQIYEQLGSMAERFKIFTTKDLVVGTSAFLNLNRDMGFTREQLFKLQEAIAILAVVNGRAMDEVQRTVALAISSGYTEGLQRLGVSINRVVIAEEAARLGFAKNYMALTEQQRALATYNLIIERTAIYQDDLLKYFDTAPGAIDRTKTSFSELKNQLGLMLATNIGLFLRDINRALDEMKEAVDRFKATRFGETLTSISEALQKLAKTEAAFKWIDNLANKITKLGLAITLILPPIGAVILAFGRLLDVSNELNQGILGDEAVGETERQARQLEDAVSESLEALEAFERDYGEKLTDIQSDYQRDLEKLERDAARRRIEIARDLQRDLAEIEREGAQKRADLQRDYFHTLEQIDAELSRDIAQENAKYAMDVAQALRAMEQRRSELEARYRENEIKAEIRFQEEMRRLREGFLFDLEDALHERDARQVLRLIRQYNLQKTQAERQFDIERDERRRAFELELQELEAQRNERLRMLAEEHAARLAALAEQAAYEKQLAAQKYEEDKAELARRLEEEKVERIAKALEAEQELAERLKQAQEDRKLLLDQQIADLNAERDRILQEIGEKLWGAVQVTTTEGLKQLYDALVDTLGEGGDADRVFQYYVASAKSASASVAGSLAALAVQMAAIAALARSLSNIGTPSFSPQSIPGAGGSGAPLPRQERQSGGEVHAGEIYKVHKDETYVPAVSGRILSVQQSQQAVSQAFSRESMGGGEGKVKIGIALSDGLVGEIIDKAGDAVADVVFELERKRK